MAASSSSRTRRMLCKHSVGACDSEKSDVTAKALSTAGT